MFELSLTWITNTLLPELQKGVVIALLANVFALCVALSIYVFRLRADKLWVRTNGVLLYIYFRNIDTRCKVLRELSMKVPLDLPRLYIEGAKLQADLVSMQSIVQTWERRTQFVSSWFPYANQFSFMLEAFNSLNVSLTRHIYPLQATLGMVNDNVVSLEKVESEVRGYFRFFQGGDNRIYGDVSFDSSPSLNRKWVFDGIVDRKNQRLHALLSAFLEGLKALMEKVNGPDLNAVVVWKADEKQGVWFSPNNDPMPQETTKFLPSQ